MAQEDWKFTEEQRDLVCEGKLCPRCLSTNVREVTHNPDLINLNIGYDCDDCQEQWEGY
jgi:hypothetical protein